MTDYTHPLFAAGTGLSSGSSLKSPYKSIVVGAERREVHVQTYTERSFESDSRRDEQYKIL